MNDFSSPCWWMQNAFSAKLKLTIPKWFRKQWSWFARSLIHIHTYTIMEHRLRTLMNHDGAAKSLFYQFTLGVKCSLSYRHCVSIDRFTPSKYLFIPYQQSSFVVVCLFVIVVVTSARYTFDSIVMMKWICAPDHDTQQKKNCFLTHMPSWIQSVYIVTKLIAKSIYWSILWVRIERWFNFR